MNWSLGECRALALKATRGAGASWGIAEEAGFASQWLEHNGLPGVAAMAAYLSTSQLPLRNTDAPPFCPLHLGARISDGEPIETGTERLVLQPLLLVPFVALCSNNGGFEITWENTNLLIRDDRVQVLSDRNGLLAQSSNLVISPSDLEIEPLQRQTRIATENQMAMDVLNQFAQRTYAPSTEESRLKGAG